MTFTPVFLYDNRLYIVKINIFYMKLSISALRFSFVGSFLFLSLVSFVSIVSAQTSELFPDADGTLSQTVINVGGATEVFATLVNLASAIAVSLAFLFFFWNLFQYIRKTDPEGKDEAKKHMGWSVLAMVIVTSLWGIIAYVRSVVGIDNDAPANPVELGSTCVIDPRTNECATT